ncbi:MAG: hypothetical protein GEU83_15865 [Pseudonocardiaceae bacterium]|nr:hypothetical protein [Pseudonocardiaceae bacterium]
MNLLVTLTLVAVGLIVVALAVSLITIVVLLRHTLFTLGTINVGLRAIARRVAPLEPVLTEVNSDLMKARNALMSALKTHQQQRNGRPQHRDTEELV